MQWHFGQGGGRGWAECEGGRGGERRGGGGAGQMRGGGGGEQTLDMKDRGNTFR